MKKLSALMYMFVAATVLFTSCGGDDETDPLAPTITTAQTDATVAPGDVVTLTVEVRQGDAKLSTLTVRESGAQIASDRLSINGEAASNSEASITSNSTVTIAITTPSTEGTFQYSVQIVDKDDVSANVEFTIVTKGASITSHAVKLIQTPTSGQNNEAFYSSSENVTYSYNTANADASIQSKIDFGYFYQTDAKLISPSEYSVASGNNDAKNEWTNLNTTMFVASSLDFANVTTTELQALDFTSGTSSTSALAVGDVVAFKTAAGVSGILTVTSLTPGFGQTDSIEIQVKLLD